MTRESSLSKCGPPSRALNCKIHFEYCNGIENKQFYIYKLSFEEHINYIRSFECLLAIAFSLIHRM